MILSKFYWRNGDLVGERQSDVAPTVGGIVYLTTDETVPPSKYEIVGEVEDRNTWVGERPKPEYLQFYVKIGV